MEHKCLACKVDQPNSDLIKCMITEKSEIY